MTVHVIEFSAVSSNPLNPLGAKLRKHISSELDKALKNKSVTAVVITGGKSGNFSAGADLTEFSQIKKGGIDEDTSLLDVVHKIENFSKPVVAAMRGVALGGGLEVALSCHYRVADTTGKFGLPEVNVGVIPGAGGTLRLPRLVGVQTALSMILTGKPIKVEKAKHLGLIDDIASPHGESLLATALKWAEWAAIMPLDNRRVGKIQVKETPEEIKMICAFAAKRLPPPEKGGKGHYAAMEAVKACTMPIKDGAAIELNLFLKTLVGAEGNAKRHAFFAVRRAQKPLGKPPAGHPLLKPSLKSQTAAVVGAGLMGSGICMVLLQAGFIVYLVDVYKQSLDKGVAFLRSTIKSYVKRGKLTEENASIMQAALKATQKLEDLSSCSLVVEAVIEDMKIKKNIFSSLDKITGPSCIILSNTSTLDVDEMASAVSPARRQLFAGWHFFSPAHIMKLVEIVVGKETSLDTICILQNLTRRVGKIGVVVGNCDGFVGNRLLISYSAETALMLEEGAGSVSAIDSAISNFGMAMGPFRMGDMAGNDIGYNVRKQRGWIGGGTSSRTMPRPARYTELPDILVAEYKRLGQKTGKGWYDYDKKIGKGRKPLPSKEVNELVKKYAKGNAPFSDSEIVERALFPLVNEGFKCLEEGIANQPSDIDVVYLYGYGWPIYRGGPMYWADHQVGLQYLLEKLNKFYQEYPQTEYYNPSKLLEMCVTMQVTVEKYYELGLHKQNSTGISKL